MAVNIHLNLFYPKYGAVGAAIPVLSFLRINLHDYHGKGVSRPPDDAHCNGIAHPLRLPLR